MGHGVNPIKQKYRNRNTAKLLQEITFVINMSISRYENYLHEL